MATIKSELDYIQEARSQLAEALITKFGVRRYDNAKDNPTLKGLWTVKADGSADKLKRLHDWALLVTGTNVHTDASLTFKNDGKGDVAGTTFNGSVARSISYNSIGAAPAVTGGYLPLSGGTMTGQIKGNNKGGSWIAGRTNAAIYLSRNTTNDWHPVIGFKTKTGSWEFGSVGSDDLATFSWGSDSNYSSGTNSATTVSLRTKSGTIALTSEIPTKASWNYDDVYSKLGHTHTTTIATSTDTSLISLTYGSKYKLTAGGTTYVFTMPTIGTGANNAAAGNHVHKNLIIKWGAGDTEGTNLFTYNGSVAKTIDLSIPFNLLFTNFGNVDTGFKATNITATISGITKSFAVNWAIYAGRSQTADKWTTARTLTIGNTGKSVDGSANISWSLAEIGVSAASHTHSVKINGATKTIAASGGTAVDLGNYLPLSGGTMSGSIILKGSTSSDMTYAGNIHPYIRFDNVDSSQNVSLIFTDYDSYRNPAGIKLIGNQGGEWFEASNIYATNFYGTLSGNASSATKLTSSAGSAALPIYFSDGKPVACVPSSLFSNLSNSDNNLSITVAGLNRTLTVNYANLAGSVAWNNVTGKPSTFTPSSHSHNNYLVKTTYDYHSEISFGLSGKCCLGKFPMYDSCVTIDIAYTTSGAYFGKLVIGTLNINSSRGGVWTARVFGDDSGVITSGLSIRYASGSNLFLVYFNCGGWGKFAAKIHCCALAGTPSDICTLITSIPTDNLIRIIRAYDNPFNFLSAEARIGCNGAYSDPLPGVTVGFKFGGTLGCTGITSAEDITARNFYSSSDIRLKNNINNISKSIRSFNWKESGLKSYGLIAQEIEDKYPELVSSNDNGYKSINYTSALCMLVAKLENTVDVLKDRIELLEQQLKMYHGNSK